MSKAKVLLELEDNHIEKMWAKAGEQDYVRVHLTPIHNSGFIKLIIESVSKSKEVMKPRKIVSESMGKEDK